MRQNTKNKYYNFMVALYEAKQFDAVQMQYQYQVSTRILTLMRERGMIKKEGNVTVWIGEQPTQALATMLRHECNRMSRLYVAQKKSQPKEQLTIKPMKRIERTQPVPVQQEQIHDNSNSKMVIILALGVLLGFLIATIIWK